MATKEHATLTGASLHEPKGADTAVANRVYISDGLGSGTWSKVNLDIVDNTFFPLYFHAQDQKSSGTSGGTFTSGDWRTRTLNTTVSNEIVGASLGSNQISLPAGKYHISASAPAVGRSSQGHVLRLRDIGSSADVIIGQASRNRSGSDQNSGSHAFLKGEFTIATNKTLELQHRCNVSESTVGLGASINVGVTEIYADVEIWQLPNV